LSTKSKEDKTKEVSNASCVPTPPNITVLSLVGMSVGKKFPVETDNDLQKQLRVRYFLPNSCYKCNLFFHTLYDEQVIRFIKTKNEEGPMGEPRAEETGKQIIVLPVPCRWRQTP
jgi:RNase adaptor protein for sRNA GlmZ degradation